MKRFGLVAFGAYILLCRRMRDISQRAWKYCAAILTAPPVATPYSAPSVPEETTTLEVTTRHTMPPMTSLGRYVSARKLTRPEETAARSVKPAKKEVWTRNVTSREKHSITHGEIIEAQSFYERFQSLLPIEDFVPKHLDLVCVQNILLIFLSPGTYMLRFGDHPLGYIDLKKALLRKGMLPDASEQCIAWLDKIRVIVDVKGGYEIRRKRAKGMRRYSINARRDDVRYPADEIINLMISANQKIRNFSSGKG